MFIPLPRIFCLCLCFSSIAGKAIDVEFGYQEITDDAAALQPDLEETNHIEIDKLTDPILEEICKNFRITIHVKETNSYITCLANPFDNNEEVKMVKRDTSDIKEEVEGSGDDEKVAGNPNENAETIINSQSRETDPPVSLLSGDHIMKSVPEEGNNAENLFTNKKEIAQMTTDGKSATATDDEKVTGNPNENAADEAEISERKFQELPNSMTRPSTSTSETITSSQSIKTDLPVTYRIGFDHIVKKEGNNTNKKENAQMTTATGEIAKTGESKEEPTAASPNSLLLIVIAALGIIGTMAFAFNYIKRKREEREVDEVMKLEAEGKELKEMKPLMKNPLQQNGARSMEYIDAEPQDENISDTKVEVVNEDEERQ